MSPILVRPVREQLEHDRIIRLLQAKSKRKYDAGMNPGGEQNIAVGTPPAALYPDLVLHSLERGRRLQAVVEVETGESVNHLEALAQWANFGRVRAAFQLYVPSSMVEVARRLCEDNQINVSEIWSYHTVGEDVRFTLVHRGREVAAPARSSAPRPVAKASPAKASPVKASPAKASVKPKAAASARPKARPAPPRTKPRSSKPSAAGKKPSRTAKRK